MVDVWREVLAVASEVGIGEAYTAALAVLFPNVEPIPHWWGVDIERFSAITWTAANGFGDCLSRADAAAARRLAGDAGWQDALANVNYLSTDFEDPLTAALAVDLNELDAQWALEQAAARCRSSRRRTNQGVELSEIAQVQSFRNRRDGDCQLCNDLSLSAIKAQN